MRHLSKQGNHILGADASDNKGFAGPGSNASARHEFPPTIRLYVQLILLSLFSSLMMSR